MMVRPSRVTLLTHCGIAAMMLAGCSNTTTIPLESVVSTSGQTGLQHARRGTKDGEYVVPYGRSLDELYEHPVGASTIFLVDAPTLTDAVHVSTRVIAGYHTADWPPTLNKPDPPRGNYWLVVFLGIRGSGPVHWLVDSVTVQGNVVRFNYHRQGIGAETCDIHQYFYWVPLGNLDSGSYTLECYDTQAKVVTLMRRAEVK